MTDAVIVSTARTPIGKAYEGALNNTEGATMLGHAISAALLKAKIEGGEVEDSPESAAAPEAAEPAEQPAEASPKNWYIISSQVICP